MSKWEILVPILYGIAAFIMIFSIIYLALDISKENMDNKDEHKIELTILNKMQAGVERLFRKNAGYSGNYNEMWIDGYIYGIEQMREELLYIINEIKAEYNGQ